MAFNAITQSEVQANKPISTTLMEKVRTNFDDHEARLLAIGSGELVGEVLNGSFEAADVSVPTWPKNWACSNGGGGLVQLTYDSDHGKRAIQIQHNVGGGGGAYAETDYISVSPSFIPPFRMSYKASVAGLYVAVRVRYFIADGSGNPGSVIGTEADLYVSTANPLFWTPVVIDPVPLRVNARYVKYKIIVGSGTTLGDATFDGVGVVAALGKIPYSPRIFSFAQKVWTGLTWNAYRQVETATVVIQAGYRYLVLSGYKLGGWYHDAYLRFRVGGTGATTSTVLYSGINPYPGQPPPTMAQGSMVLDLTGTTPGTYVLTLEAAANDGGYGPYGAYGDASAGYEYLGNGILSVNGHTKAATVVPPT